MTVEGGRSVLVSHADFDRHWPWVVEAFRRQWPCAGECHGRPQSGTQSRPQIGAQSRPHQGEGQDRDRSPTPTGDSNHGLEWVRLEPGDTRAAHQVVPDPASVVRLVVLGVPFTEASADEFAGLREASLLEAYGEQPTADMLRDRGVAVYGHRSEGFWGQSVAEYGLALTLCGLRRIPQLHHQIIADLAPW
ncbi:MAG TPA: hypothetical protein VE287_02000, partial [Actinopolymorphaceae bacterium]|nr:hypothetical protein [Actinopolymorphaceae bacterium]